MLFRFHLLLCLLVFSTNAFSQKPFTAKEEAKKRMRFCNEVSSKVLENLPVLKANLEQINDSLVLLELASTSYSRCNREPLSPDFSEGICRKIKKEYQQKIEEHAQMVLSNDEKQKELYLLMKEHSNQHCSM